MKDVCTKMVPINVGKGRNKRQQRKQDRKAKTNKAKEKNAYDR
jgi:hypothetical protein